MPESVYIEVGRGGNRSEVILTELERQGVATGTRVPAARACLVVMNAINDALSPFRVVAPGAHQPITPESDSEGAGKF